MKRKLDAKEMAMMLKVLESRKKEKAWTEYQIRYHELMLNEGLIMNHEKNMRDFKQKKAEFEVELKIVKNIMTEMEDQIRNGVEIKKDEKEVKDGR